MRNLLSLLLPILILTLGLPLMVATSTLVPSPKIAAVVIFLVFIAYNVIAGHFLSLNRRLKAVWSPHKIWHLLPGFLIGAIPIGTAYIWYFSKGELPAYRGITLLAALLTLATVAWEELWFRGVALELGASQYTKFGVALAFAVIFALLHIMNPKINLLEDGFQLIVAGYALSVCYFAFESIWAPVGMHFANNSIQAAFGKSTEPRTVIFTGPLVGVALILTAIVWQRGAKRREQ